MKFEVDTNRKVLTLEGTVTFDELESLKTFIGKGWEKWTIETKTVINTVYRDNYHPVYPQPYYVQPFYKDTMHFTWCDTNTKVYSTGTGVYNIEANSIKGNTLSSLMISES